MSESGAKKDLDAKWHECCVFQILRPRTKEQRFRGGFGKNLHVVQRSRGFGKRTKKGTIDHFCKLRYLNYAGRHCEKHLFSWCRNSALIGFILFSDPCLRFFYLPFIYVLVYRIFPLSVCLSTYLCFFSLSFHASVYLPTYLPTYRSVYVFNLSTHAFIEFPPYLSTHLPIYVFSLYLSVYFKPICVFSLYLPVYVFIYLSLH